MHVGAETWSTFQKSFEVQAAETWQTSFEANLTFVKDSGSGVSGHVFVLAPWHGLSECVDNRPVGDLGEKKGDWFAEKNVEEDDERFLNVVLGNDPNLELSAWRSIFTISWFCIS